jgi:hypothetical protein
VSRGRPVCREVDRALPAPTSSVAPEVGPHGQPFPRAMAGPAHVRPSGISHRGEGLPAEAQRLITRTPRRPELTTGRRGTQAPTVLRSTRWAKRGDEGRHERGRRHEMTATQLSRRPPPRLPSRTVRPRPAVTSSGGLPPGAGPDKRETVSASSGSATAGLAPLSKGAAKRPPAGEAQSRRGRCGEVPPVPATAPRGHKPRPGRSPGSRLEWAPAGQWPTRTAVSAPRSHGPAEWIPASHAGDAGSNPAGTAYVSTPCRAASPAGGVAVARGQHGGRLGVGPMLTRLTHFRSPGPVVRTPLFHSGDPGSIPGGTAFAPGASQATRGLLR